MSTVIRASVGIIAAISLGLIFNLKGQERKSSTPYFRAEVETVFVKVSVADPLNRYVTGLEKEHFKIYEDKIEQTISYFNTEDAPMSVGIVFDVSSSMKENDNIKKAKKSIARFLQHGNPKDEYCLITFNQKTKLLQSFTDQSVSVLSEVSIQHTGGSTAIYDAVYMGLDQIKRGKNENKALILITDGEDNSSRYSASEVREFAMESAVQIYAIGQKGALGYGYDEIATIVGITGGRAFFPLSLGDLDYYIDLIHAELRSQYLLGYSPTNKLHDGKWRRIKVKLDAPEGLPKLTVHAKEGYYAPKN
jgi:Ca-activated chloride channel homolog